MADQLRVALLRGINVGGKNKIRMVDLRDLAAGLGWRDARTYIQSGNLVFSASGRARALETQLEDAIRQRLGLTIPALVRTGATWSSTLAHNPLPEASSADPKHVMLALSKQRPRASALDELRDRATHGEVVERVGDALWIHCPEGAARSKLTPKFMDRAVGSTVTARNWRTVLELGKLLARK